MAKSIKGIETIEIVKEINEELNRNTLMTVGEVITVLGYSQNSIKERFRNDGYTFNKAIRQYKKDTKKDNTKCSINTTGKEIAIDKDKKNTTRDNTKCNTYTTDNNTKCSIDTTNNTTQYTTVNLSSIDADKLSLLVDNADKIMALITPKDNTVVCNTTKTKVTSLRINEDIYNLVKDRASKERISIQEIVNNALIDYLNK